MYSTATTSICTLYTIQGDYLNSEHSSLSLIFFVAVPHKIIIFAHTSRYSMRFRKKQFFFLLTIIIVIFLGNFNVLTYEFQFDDLP